MNGPEDCGKAAAMAGIKRIYQHLDFRRQAGKGLVLDCTPRLRSSWMVLGSGAALPTAVLWKPKSLTLSPQAKAASRAANAASDKWYCKNAPGTNSGAYHCQDV